jgi:hypothetical protein
MTVPCTSCGEALTPDDLRCPTCGTLAPPRPGASVFVSEGPAPRWAGDGTPSRDETLVEPWSIPIREAPRPAGPVAAGPSDSARAVTYGVVVVAVLVAVVALASSVLGSGDDDVASGGDSTTTEPDTDAEVLGDVEAGDATTTTTSTSTTTSSSTSTTSTTTTAPPTTTTTTVARASTGKVPALSPSFRSGWVAQLTSVPVSAGSSALEASWDRVRADVPGAVAARSDDWPSLSPGYWVLVAPGPFGSDDDVRAFCSSAGRSSDSCLPRMLADRR